MTGEEEPEQIIYRSIKESQYDIHQINLPKSNEFFHYGDYRLHVRTFWPENQPPKAIVMFIHGYISHINRPTHGYLGPFFKNHNLAYVGFDFPGHGYSDGERALVNSVEELIDSAFHAIEIFYKESTSSTDHFINRPYPIDPKTPLILIGHSMGGSTALLLGEQLKKTNYHFIGSIYLCPAIQIPAIPPAVRFFLDYIIAPLLPSTPLPPWLNREHNPKNTWNDDDYIKYVKADHYPQNPEGLGWGENLRFWSAAILLQLADTAYAAAPNVDHPFLMIHDPDDKTVRYSGAEHLMENCATPKEQRELLLLEGGGHDILINRLGVISRKIVEWIHNQLSKQS